MVTYAQKKDERNFFINLKMVLTSRPYGGL